MKLSIVFDRLKTVLRIKTSGHKILTKGRIAPALVTPAAGESILKPCTLAVMRCPLWTSLQLKRLK